MNFKDTLRQTFDDELLSTTLLISALHNCSATHTTRTQHTRNFKTFTQNKMDGEATLGFTENYQHVYTLFAHSQQQPPQPQLFPSPCPLHPTSTQTKQGAFTNKQDSFASQTSKKKNSTRGKHLLNPRTFQKTRRRLLLQRRPRCQMSCQRRWDRSKRCKRRWTLQKS